MRLSTFNKNLGRMNGLFTFLFGILLIPISVNANTYNFDYKHYSETSCTEMATALFTPGDSYTALNIFNTICLGNATTPTNGQFMSTITIEGESNTIWYIDDAIGYYDPAFQLPADPPTPFTYGEMGDTFTPGFHPHPDSSVYTLDVLTIHGEPNLIRLRSNKDDIVTLIGSSPKYEKALIDGPISLCNDATVTYRATGYPGPYDW